MAVTRAQLDKRLAELRMSQATFARNYTALTGAIACIETLIRENSDDDAKAAEKVAEKPSEGKDGSDPTW